jgi:hypothetical protein
VAMASFPDQLQLVHGARDLCRDHSRRASVRAVLDLLHFAQNIMGISVLKETRKVGSLGETATAILEWFVGIIMSLSPSQPYDFMIWNVASVIAHLTEGNLSMSTAQGRTKVRPKRFRVASMCCKQRLHLVVTETFTWPDNLQSPASKLRQPSYNP